MLNWANQFSIFCFLDSNNYQDSQSSFDWMLAVDATQSFVSNDSDFFSSLKEFSVNNPEWIFGHINYPSARKDSIAFPDAFFFVPKIILQLKANELSIQTTDNAKNIFEEINNESSGLKKAVQSEIKVSQLLTKEKYTDIIQSLRKHIQRGDCYEINFCQEFIADNADLNPTALYFELCKVSPNPFSALYKLNNKFCVCASPERFLKKSGNKVLSQPIKGTSKRNLQDTAKDEELKTALLNSKKERSENVMIVDLVRNDLSRICKKGSVKVTELFGIYSFPQVHQMISTIEGEVDEQIHWTEIIDVCFPMGSMTGAPKKRVMELIEQYEASPRGLFSGTIGYVTPDGDFDFNVVIRSLFYDDEKKHLSFNAGGGITFNSNAEDEYEESLIKTNAIRKILK